MQPSALQPRLILQAPSFFILKQRPMINFKNVKDSDLVSTINLYLAELKSLTISVQPLDYIEGKTNIIHASEFENSYFPQQYKS